MGALVKLPSVEVAIAELSEAGPYSTCTPWHPPGIRFPLATRSVSATFAKRTIGQVVEKLILESRAVGGALSTRLRAVAVAMLPFTSVATRGISFAPSEVFA